MSAYFRPSNDNISSLFHSAFQNLVSPFTIIAMDSNANNRLWNSPTTDAKGVELECLIHSENLSIINSNTSDLDFTPGGTSFLDVTLAGDKVVVSPCHTGSFLLYPRSQIILTYTLKFHALVMSLV